MKKKRIYILLLTIEIMLNSIIPFHISVATEKIPSTNLQEKNSETQLLQDEISKLIKNIFVIDSYAEKIQNLERTTLEHIILIDEELGKKISRHQEQARKHTEDWLYNIKKEIICLSENLMNAKFEKSLDELSYGIKIKNTEIIQQEMKDLLGIINDSKNQVNKLIETLKTFRYKVSHDYQFFKEDNHSLERLLKIDNTNITMLKTQINDFNDSIHKLEKSQFACLLGALVCFPILGITESKISDIQKEKQYVKDKLSQKEKEVAILNDLEYMYTNVVSSIDKAIISIENISNYIKPILSKYNNLLKNNESSSIERSFNLLKQRWTKLTEYINGIDRDMKKLIKIVSTKLGYVNNSYWSCELFVIPGQTYTLKYKTTNQLGLTVTENDEYLVWEEKKSHDKVTTFIPKTNKITLQFYGLGTFDYLLLRGNQKD